jgi:prepilin-type N-terminal cleavage/methylation domain-containing protein
MSVCLALSTRSLSQRKRLTLPEISVMPTYDFFEVMISVPEISMKQNQGFTLIELLIVVAIIAILAAIAVPNFLEAQVRAKVSRVKADMRSMATALESYVVDNNKYPPAWDYDPAGPNRTPGSTIEIPGGPFHSRMSTMLTTPIAYVSSLTDDPFRQNNTGAIAANLLPVKNRQTYFNIDFLYEAFPSTVPPAVNNFSQAETLGGKWFFYSVGPDKDEFNTPAGGSTVGQRVYRDYDPTNGTISLGNVFRSQKSGERLGTLPFFYTTP